MPNSASLASHDQLRAAVFYKRWLCTKLLLQVRVFLYWRASEDYADFLTMQGTLVGQVR